MFNSDVGNLSALRTFRVLRALKTVAVVPGMLSRPFVRLFLERVKRFIYILPHDSQ